ncbi:TetR/AcrR family transcriptional regulator [Corynebacterium mendelii]|uniref:TetR family transcriptional regulator n=1 Tax=Corynebacterium mendelii TaxID=2765362 RepID=A0A939DZ09_9CORY|nr:TetR family transcriptional regulator [Corynebacterium mendelii]MBN9643440.1 TetR family transcriptional regulator [Corynebacterium mendelii]
MAGQPGPTSRRAGLSPDTVIDAAISLAHIHGIDGWSVRALAAELDVVPSVIYHYFSTKTDLIDAVTDRIYASAQLPDDSLEWKQWFRQLAHNLRPVLLDYPGLADRMMRAHMPDSAFSTLDTGLRKLEDAGFGDTAVMVYSMILNVAVSSVVIRDAKSPNYPGPRQDMDALVAKLEPMAATSGPISRFLDTFVGLIRNDQQAAEDISTTYYTMTIDAVLAGVEQTILTPLLEQR